MVRRIGFLIALLLAVVTGIGAVAAVVLVRMDMRPRIESLASARLGRAVTIQTLAIGWGSPIVVEATGLRLANPAWGSTPDMVSIGRLHAEVAVWPLLHGVLNLSQVVVDRPVVVLERDAGGMGNWVLSASGQRPPAARSPEVPPAHFIADFRLENGDLSFRTTRHNLLRVHVAAAGLQAANDAAPVMLHAEGSYNDLPLVADATLESFAALRQVPRPVEAEVTVAEKRSTLRFKGAITDPIGFDGIAGKIDVAAAALDELSEGVRGPRISDAKLAVTGMLDKQGDHWRLTELAGAVADTTVAGSVGLDEGKRGQPDHFEVNLDFAALDLRRLSARMLSDLAPQTGPKGIPLHVDENPAETYAVRIGVKEAVYGRYKLDALGVQASLEPARIALKKLSFGFAEGRVDVSGTDEAAGAGGHLTLDATLSGVSAERIVAMAGADAAMLAGKLDARATLQMTGTTTEDGLADSHGQAVLSMTRGRVSREFLELASLDLRLLLRKGGGYTSVVCFLAVAEMRNGAVSLAPLRLRTREGNFSGGGQLDLRRDAMDLYLQSDSKSTHFWALDIPLRITGSLASPQVRPSTRSAAPALNARGAENLRLLSPDLRQTASGNRC